MSWPALSRKTYTNRYHMGYVYLLVTFIIVMLLINLQMDTSQRREVPFKRLKEDSSCPATNIITIVPGGRLGNAIWEYMSLLVTVRLHGNKLKATTHIPKRIRNKMEYLFERVNNISEITELSPSCLGYYTPYDLTFNRSFVPKDGVRYYITLKKYSSRYEDVVKYGIYKIKNELRFHQEYVDYSYNTLSQFTEQFNVLRSNVTYVGMHYRGSEYPMYLRKRYRNLFKGSPDYKYYTKAMDYFKEKYGSVIFILITIDKGWLRKNISFLDKDNNLIVNPNKSNAIKDLVLLSYCNHSIISYGSFAVTAALFAAGTTYVYDTGFPLDRTGPALTLGLADLLPSWHLLK